MMQKYGGVDSTFEEDKRLLMESSSDDSIENDKTVVPSNVGPSRKAVIDELCKGSSSSSENSEENEKEVNNDEEFFKAYESGGVTSNNNHSIGGQPKQGK
jgi:hypothetical protein